MLGELAKKRKNYYSMISTYQMRREELRRRYNIPNKHQGRTRMPDEYREKVKVLQRKIDIWKLEIKRLDAMYDKIRSLERGVVEFFQTPIKNIGKKFSEHTRIAKSVYYKYGLENNLPAYRLRGYLNAKDITQPARYRTKFTASFKSTPENKETWLNFKSFFIGKHIVRKRKTKPSYPPKNNVQLILQ